MWRCASWRGVRWCRTARRRRRWSMRELRKVIATEVALAVALGLVLASGRVDARDGRDHAPSFDAPAAFAWAPAHGEAVAGDAEFWRGFDDPQLVALVEQALAANTDLRVALARFDSANALLRSARFDSLPTITAEAGAVDQRLSASERPGIDRADRDGEAYSIDARLSWELDFFGRVRHGVAAQRADTAAVGADLQALQVLIVADVSRTYFTLRGLQERLRVAQENVASQAGTLRLVEAGLAA